MRALTFLLFAAVLANAAPDTVMQDTTKRPTFHSLPRQYSTYIGIAGGYTSGYGLSIRKWFHNSWALQLNVFPYFNQTKMSGAPGAADPNSGYKNEGNLSVGMLYLKQLTEFRFGRITAYGGGNLLTDYEKYDYYATSEKWNSQNMFYEDTTIHYAGRTLSNKVTIGGGAGAEFYIWRFSLHLLLGLCAGYDINSNLFSVLPSVEGGIQFRL
jgi:hypothetical protein